MAPDSFTEVTSQSWFSRIGGAIKGVLVGLIIFIVAFPVLFVNEGSSVKRYKTLKEGGGSVVSVASDKVDQANVGKLVHMTGRAVTEDQLSDPIFGISDQALSLKRDVEMYQWDEDSQSKERKKLGGGTETVTVYNYSKKWSDSVISSGSFKTPDGHQNPGGMAYESMTQVATGVTLGAFTLPSFLVSKINNYEPVIIKAETAVPAELKDTAQISNNGFYIGKNPLQPEIGDLKVSFKVVKPCDISVVAQQDGNTFKPFKAAAGGTIELLSIGVQSADEMFQKAEEANRFKTWVVRLVGFVLMFIGLMMMLKPLSVIADVIPLLGDLLGAGLGLICFLVAALLSVTTVAIAWFVYRPVLGVGLLAVATALFVVLSGKIKKSKAASASGVTEQQ